MAKTTVRSLLRTFGVDADEDLYPEAFERIEGRLETEVVATHPDHSFRMPVHEEHLCVITGWESREREGEELVALRIHNNIAQSNEMAGDHPKWIVDIAESQVKFVESMVLGDMREPERTQWKDGFAAAVLRGTPYGQRPHSSLVCSIPGEDYQVIHELMQGLQMTYPTLSKSVHYEFVYSDKPVPNVPPSPFGNVSEVHVIATNLDIDDFRLVANYVVAWKQSMD